MTPDDAGALAREPAGCASTTPGSLARRLPTHPGWYLEAAAYRRAVRSLPRDVEQLLHFVDARTALLTRSRCPSSAP